MLMKKSGSKWLNTNATNLLKNADSGIYYARIRVVGKRNLNGSRL